jgi:hypothetical protein
MSPKGGADLLGIDLQGLSGFYFYLYDSSLDFTADLNCLYCI